MENVTAPVVQPQVEAGGKKNSTQNATEALLGQAEFFHDQNGVPYAAVHTGKCVEVWPVNSREFERIIARFYYLNNGVFSKKAAIAQIKTELEWMAILEGYEYQTYTRYAGGEGVVYVNLCNELGEIVEISAEGWRITKQALGPPFFLRFPGMLSLPYPERGGDMRELAEFINIGKEDDFILVASLVLGCMNPDGPYPISIFHGSQGSGKSTMLKLLGELIDPSAAALAALPRSERDLFIAAMRTWLLRFDNVSQLKQAMSDAICRLSTEGEIRLRKLFTNTQEVILKAKRPSFFNGISEFAYQNDLLDRAISFYLSTISAADRLPESEIRARWEAAKPRILGAFYDTMVEALKNIDHVKLGPLPRMADFARWVVAAEPACPWENGRFLKAYENNRLEMVDMALEADPVAEAVLKLLSGLDDWEGTASELLNYLKGKYKEISEKPEWPKSPITLSNRLMRLEGFLATKGITIEKKRTPDKRLIILRKFEGQTVAEAQEVSTAPEAMEMVA